MSHAHGPDHGHAERFVPEEMGGRLIEAEHQVRYRVSLGLAPGRRVLDAGCGVGWGSLLLQQAGAASVVGLDISPEALADAGRRAPDCTFVLGDLQTMPFDDGEFDMVVCLEALEHTKDTSATLDELTRVLRPGGVLLVSSPNPGVYPQDNPYHLHELTLRELQAGLEARFSHVAPFRQHTLLTSALLPVNGGLPTPFEPFDLEALAVAPVAPGAETYAVALASDEALPHVRPWAGLAPPTEFDDLVSDRVTMLAELSDAHARLRDADAALRSVMAERDEAGQRAADLHTRWQAGDVQLRNLRLAMDNAVAERDDLLVRLLAAEQQLAGVPRPGATVPVDELTGVQAEVAKLRRTLRRRRGTAVRLRARNKVLRDRARRARAREAKAAAELARLQGTLPRRVGRRLRAVLPGKR